MQSSELKYKLKDLPINQRPREKLLLVGVEVLDDAELLAILIQKGTHKQTALDLSYAMLSKFGSLSDLQNIGVGELLKLHGIGFAKACQIKAAFELSKRMREEIPNHKTHLSSAKDVYVFMKNRFLLEKKEYFYILLLDIKNRLIKESMISQGTLTASIFYSQMLA